MFHHTTLRRLWPNAPQATIDAIASTADGALTRFEINTLLRFAHFMAQISHESGGGQIKVENLNYTTAERLKVVWPSRFNVAKYPRTATDPTPFVRNPRRLANQVYNGRMGNRPGTDDGFNYRGRGLMQLTGREAYQRMGKLVGLDLEGRPELAAEPEHSFEIAAAEFNRSGCLPFADRDDIVSVTKRINGGLIGLDDRKAWLAKWKAAL